MDDGCCSSCHLVLKQPFVSCHPCKGVLICLECFSKGKEFDKHKNNHRYRIVHENFAVCDDNTAWSHTEESKLLEALVQKGEGNWDDISKTLGNKSPQECQLHYEKFYLENGTFPHFDLEVGQRQDQPVIFAPIEGNLACSNH